MERPLCSLVISTYNRPDALEMCLESVAHQSTLPNQIVIADDGSTEATQTLIKKFRSRILSDVVHVWQEHIGFRVARIRNLALKSVSHPYVIQIDGDMVLQKCFIHDHLRFAERGYYVRGNKCMLSADQTFTVLKNGIHTIQRFSFPFGILPKSSRVVVLRNLFSVYRSDIKGVFGSNMAYWFDDAKAVNGYSNHFTGWGSEDDDFADRLRMSGTKCKAIKFGAIAFHLDHSVEERSRVDINNQLRRDNAGLQKLIAVNGMNEVE